MGLITTKPGMSDEDTKRYFEINNEIIELQNKLNNLSMDEKEKKRKLEDEINHLRMEQIMLDRNLKF